MTIKKLLGHANFATTAGYLHVSAEQAVRVRSPLDVIAPMSPPAAVCDHLSNPR